MKTMFETAALALAVTLCAFTLQATAAEDFKCADCHDISLAKSVHADGPSCTDCHADVKDLTHAENGVKPTICTDCHSDMAPGENDIHLRLKERVGDLAPTCATCHGGHDIQPIATITQPVQQICGTCHDTTVQLKTKWHERPFVPNQDCLDCHDAKPYLAQTQKSVHADFACADCHTYAAAKPMEHADETPAVNIATCANCHADVAATHADSIHGISLAEAVSEAANCWNCHGSHEIVHTKEKTSPVNPINLADTCGKCHGDPTFETKFGIGRRNVIADYKDSVHGKLAQSGDEKAPSCAVCHNAHDIRNRVQPNSPISSFNVPDTCGQCHSEIAAEYKQSVHWVYAKRGVKESPVCNDCHSEHSIHQVNSPNKRQESRRLQNDTCVHCHQDPVLARKFNLDSNRAGDYLDSYHGLAVMRGDPDAAMCFDCHGVHKILPQSHPESMVNTDQVINTCQTCHPTATTNFSRSYSHNAIVKESRSIEYFVKTIYVWMIVIVIGGMLAHNLLILWYELRDHYKEERSRIAIHRFGRNAVVQHMVMMIAFTLLAITGFALKYHDFPLFVLLSKLGMDEPVRQFIHRFFGVVIVALGLYHIIFLLISRAGRNMLFHIIPRPRDIRDTIHNILYHLRISKTHPEFAHFNYIEKSEYWALIWGTIIMALTGFFLWFPTMVGDWAPIWVIRVSEIIHFYEAILATLAILVWHLFFVIYHPKEYPMNLTWMDGSISLQTFKSHYRGQYKVMIQEWHRLQRGEITEKQLSYDTQGFLAAIRKHGDDPDAILHAELASDPELRQWLNIDDKPADNTDKPTDPTT